MLQYINIMHCIGLKNTKHITYIMHLRINSICTAQKHNQGGKKYNCFKYLMVSQCTEYNRIPSLKLDFFMSVTNEDIYQIKKKLQNTQFIKALLEVSKSGGGGG